MAQVDKVMITWAMRAFKICLRDASCLNLLGIRGIRVYLSVPYGSHALVFAKCYMHSKAN